VTRRARLAARFPARPPVTDDHANAHAERFSLWPRLLALPARQRAVLVLGYYEDLPDVEIAAVLGCSPDSVRVYRARALAALRLELSTVGSGEEEK
jgi:RNA polymerase sigma factor (sigma-70 family)